VGVRPLRERESDGAATTPRLIGAFDTFVLPNSGFLWHDQGIFEAYEKL
jgi:hypothetical protein